MGKLLQTRQWEIGNSSLDQIWHKWVQIQAKYGNGDLVVNSQKPKKSYIEYCSGILC